MRIGFDATVLCSSTRYTGSGEHAANLLQCLSRIGSDNSYVAFSTATTTRPEGLGENVQWVRMPGLPFGRLSAIVQHLVVLPVLARRYQLDIFHTPFVHTRPSLPPVPRCLGVPLVVTLHDLIPLTFYGEVANGLSRRMRMFYRWNLKAARRADKIITVSEASRREIIELLGVDQNKVTVIYNGVNAPSEHAVTPLEIERRFNIRSPYMLFCGSFEPRKNLRRLLEAFDLACRRGLIHELVLVVEQQSGHASKLYEQARSLSCRRNIRFLHSLPDEQLQALYANAEALIFPSLSEGFGLPPLQAMAHGTPVIASAIPALKEVLQEAAHYFDPYDVGEIATALGRVATHDEFRMRLSEAGLKQAAKYDWSKAARETLQVYEKMSG